MRDLFAVAIVFLVDIRMSQETIQVSSWVRGRCETVLSSAVYIRSVKS